MPRSLIWKDPYFFFLLRFQPDLDFFMSVFIRTLFGFSSKLTPAVRNGGKWKVGLFFQRQCQYLFADTVIIIVVVAAAAATTTAAIVVVVVVFVVAAAVVANDDNVEDVIVQVLPVIIVVQWHRNLNISFKKRKKRKRNPDTFPSHPVTIIQLVFPPNYKGDRKSHKDCEETARLNREKKSPSFILVHLRDTLANLTKSPPNIIKEDQANVRSYYFSSDVL